MKIYSKRKNCRLCYSKKLKIGFKLKPSPFGDIFFNSKKKAIKGHKVPITVYRCENCKHIQNSEYVNPKLLWKDYTYLSSQSQMIIDHLKDVSKTVIKKYRLSTKDLVVDIGSNDGTFLKNFKTKRIKIFGVDPAKNVAKIANKNGIKTLASPINKKAVNKIIKKSGKAKIVLAFNVFAHNNNMNDFVRCVNDLLAKDSYFVFEAQYLRDIYKKKILGTFLHEHISHHSIFSLQNFFKKHNLNFYDLEFNNIQKGSIVGFVSNNLKLKKTKKFEKALIREKKEKINTLAKVRSFNAYIDKNFSLCQKILKKYKNKLITGFGSARMGPIYAINFGFMNKISYLFDDHFMKVNKYTNVTAKKVLPSKDINKLKPSICFVLAIEHLKNIVLKNVQYLREGGKFVSVFPKVQEIDYKNYKKIVLK